MVSTTTFPRKSVIVAVIVWTPLISRSVERLEPVAEPTCRSDVQTMSSLMSPSSASVAVPWRVTMEPELKTEPSAGPSMERTGRVSDTVTVMLSVDVLLLESVTVAVMV